MSRTPIIVEVIKSYSKYSDLYEQIADCKYDDISIEIDKYPLYNTNAAHLIIKSKEGPWYMKFVTQSQFPFYMPLYEWKLQRYIETARRFFKDVKEHEELYKPI